MIKLAIIIPAYKDDFLPEALESLASQSCKDFNVYIGDDCSPYNLKSVVEKFDSKLNITYHRFDSNVGGKDLVTQWERCIQMSQNEPWIWLFSDDDVMEPQCVESFFNALEQTNSQYDVYHFDVLGINASSKVITTPPTYPKVYSSYDFYRDKMKGKVLSFVVENVFSRSIWEKTGGFQNFDLAWGSDTATWVKFMQFTGMYTIKDVYVRWRSSDQNISPNNSEAIVIRKTNALIDYYQWAYTFFKKNKIDCRWTNIITYFTRLASFKRYVKYSHVSGCNLKFCQSQGVKWLYPILNLLVKIR